MANYDKNEIIKGIESPSHDYHVFDDLRNKLNTFLT